MRWLGALLVAGACGGAGFVRTASLARQIRLLDDVCTLLRHMENELRQRNTPLPELFVQQADRHLVQMAEQLRRGTPLAEVARSYLERLEHKYGLAESARCLGRLALVLGRYDGCTQAAWCKQTLEELEGQQAALRKELSEKGTLYRIAPLAFGLMAALAVL